MRIASSILLGVLLLSGLVVSASEEQTIEVNRVLEKESLSGTRPDFGHNSCTFALRVKFLSEGGPVDRGASSRGMIFSVASGYYDGIRAWYSWEDHSLWYEIGRTREQSSISVKKADVSPHILHDLVCVYDGKSMRLYVDGTLAAEKEYMGTLDSKNASIKVGYGGFGIGWSKMFVDRLEYFPRAMNAEEVAKRFQKHPALEKESLSLFAQYHPLFAVVNMDTPPDLFTRLLQKAKEIPDLPAQISNEYWKRLWLAGGRENASQLFPLLKQNAEKMLKATLPSAEKNDLYHPFVSELYSVTDALASVAQLCGNEQAGSLLADLEKKFPEPMKLRRKVERLKTEMTDRAQKLETQSGKRFSALLAVSSRAEIFLSPNGSDTNEGTRDKPLATLSAALDAARNLSGRGQAVSVVVSDGVYYCDKTATIENTGDSTKFGSIIVQAAPGAAPVFTGKKTLDNFQPVTDPDVLQRFDETVRNHIVVCDLRKNGVTDFGAVTNRGYPVSDVMPPWTDVYVNDCPQTLARWPNENEKLLSFGEVVPGPHAVLQGRHKRSDSDTFHYQFDRPNRWKLSEKVAETDIWINGLFQAEWAGDTRKVLQIDREKKLIQVDYHDISGRYHYYFRNILEELDRAGEFYIDRAAGLLYLYPPQQEQNARSSAGENAGVAEKKAKVEMAVFNGPFVRLSRVSNCLFSGLTFTGCRTTAFWAENCVDCYLSQCRIEEMGVHAVVMKNCSWSGVYSCRLKKLGGCGVRLTGGNRASLTPSGLTVHNTEIASFCQVDRAYAAAIQTTGCGMTATNNLIYDSPHHAFRMDGNDQYCARNEVHSVVYEYSDQSGIDIYCDPMYRGIVIEKNFWHHIGSSLALCGQAGIRLDDSISGVVMTDNIFYRSSGGQFGGIQIHGGKDNLCQGNLFVCCKKAFSFGPWTTDRYLRNFIHGHFGTNVSNYLEKKVYPFVDEDLEKYINRNFIFYNRMINCEKFQTNGNLWDQFVGNSWQTIQSTPTTDDSIPTPARLRTWIEKISGRDMSRIGLINVSPSPENRISPHYSEN
ncbi:MAG: right-handed parallel beta-helix repeat-containing protein [Thermoguttaceae bacterium]|nr:right-handed parallel beta-helix repeat-containing protein [Thermoguttaceae bacterium]